MSGLRGPPGKSSDRMSAMGDALGDLEDLALEDLGAPSAPDPVPARNEDSFADARLDAPSGEPLRSGDNTDDDAASSGAADLGLDEGAEVGLDLALVAGGAVLVSPRDRAQGKKADATAAAAKAAPVLESRGATSIAAPSQVGPVPAGHMVRPRGIFAWDPISNALAATLLGLLVAALPAYLIASSYADSQEVQTSFETMRGLRIDLVDLADPGREAEGPQGTDAVASALQGVANGIDQEAASVDEVMAGSGVRFWGSWLGIGLPLIVALALLRRKP